MSQLTQAEALERVREINADFAKSCTSAITEIAMDDEGVATFDPTHKGAGEGRHPGNPGEAGAEIVT